jgi:hypothetical protein
MNDTHHLRTYRVLCTVTRDELYAIKAASMEEAVRTAFSSGKLVRTYGVRDIVEAEVDEAVPTAESNACELRGASADALNARRAGRAQSALTRFMQDTGADREDSLSDLLADLMHWAQRNSFDFAAALARAGGYFQAELAEDD